MKVQKTYRAKPGEVKKSWLIVDLKGKTLGRAASAVARLLIGKHKPQYSPDVDVGDFVVCINADQIRLSGNKLTDKIYYWHTGAIGGIKSASAADMLKKNSAKVIEAAVQGMLPKNKIGKHMASKLKVYKGAEHIHAAQNPKPIEI